MSMVLIEVDELKNIITETVNQVVQQKDDERLYLTTKEFAENIGITFQYFKDHLLYAPEFQKVVIQKDRKIYIKRELGRQIADQIMNQYRR